MLISRFAGSRDPHPQLAEVDWPPVSPPVRHHGPKEALPAWSPATFAEGARRSNASAIALSCGVLDFDDVGIDDISQLLDALEGVRAVIHSTWSHRAGSPTLRFRAVLAFSHPCPRERWADAHARLTSLYGASADPQCSDPARLYFGAYHPPGGSGFWFESAGEPLNWEELPESRRILRARELREVARKWTRTRSRRDLGLALGRLVDGEPYAEPGQRHETLRDVAWYLACEFPRLHVDALVAVCTPSLDHPDSDGSDVETFRAMLESALAKVEEGEPVERDASRMREAWRSVGVDRDSPLTVEEVKALGVAQHEWLIECAGAVWIHGPTGYQGPFRDRSAPTAALSLLSVAPVQLHAEKRARTLGELLAAHGRTVAGVVYDLTTSRTGLDETGQVLRVATAPLRPLEPLFCPEVATWLQALASESFPALCKWLSYLPELDKPCSALFLHGKKGTGKSLLGNEIAKLWTTEGPTPIEHAVGAFNASLARCPYVFADERVPREIADKTKELIASRERTWSQKYVATAPLRGCLRLAIAANNTRFFESLGDLTRHDVEALAERFLFVECSPDAVEVLQRYDVMRWVREDRIPRFALWLQRTLENRTPDGRFLVQSESSAFYDALSAGTGLRSAIVQWCVGYMLAPKSVDRAAKDAPKTRTATTRDGVIVQPATIYQTWAHHVTDGFCPPLARVANAVREIGQERRLSATTRTRGYLISRETITTWAAQTGAADLDALDALFEKSEEVLEKRS